jgi:membrane-associated phospholipid phosphatase
MRILPHGKNFRRSLPAVTISSLVSIALLLASAMPSSGSEASGGGVPASGSNSASISFLQLPYPRIHDFLSRRTVAITLLGGIAALVSSQVDDDEFMARSLDKDRFLLSGGIDVGDAYGNGATLAIGTLGLLLIGKIGKQPALADAGSDLARSLLTSTAVVWSLKMAINRQRPGGGNYSFPSGHAAGAFSVAPVLHHHFGWKVGIPAYTVAALAGLGRMEDRRHYLSDVLFGATIGLAAGEAVVNRESPLRMFENFFVHPRGFSISKKF